MSKQSVKAGFPVLPVSMDKGSLSGDPAKPDDERLPWKLVDAQADMPNKHIANTGGPYKCRVPAMPKVWCGKLETWPNGAPRTKCRHHS